MAGLLDLFGGGGSDPYDIYGDLFTDKQKQAMREQQQGQGLLRMAAALGQAAMPSRMPVPIGAVLGSAAGALGTGQDAQMEQMLKAAQTAEAVRQSQQTRELMAKIFPYAARLAAGGAPGAPAAAPVAPVPGGGPAAAAPIVPAPDADLMGGYSGAPASAGTGDFPTGAPPARAKSASLGDPNAGLLAAYGPPDQLVGQAPSQLQGLLSAAYGGAAPPPFSLASLSGGSGGGSPGTDDQAERELALVRQYESGNRNINQQVIGPQGGYNPSVGRVTGPSSASGYYQMIDSTWRHAASQAGIDTQQWRRAIDAPFDLQHKAALALREEQGMAPWAPYNSNLSAALGGRAGGRFAGMGPVRGGGGAPDTVLPSGDNPDLAALTALTGLLGLSGGGGGLPDLASLIKLTSGPGGLSMPPSSGGGFGPTPAATSAGEDQEAPPTPPAFQQGLSPEVYRQRYGQAYPPGALEGGGLRAGSGGGAAPAPAAAMPAAPLATPPAVGPLATPAGAGAALATPSAAGAALATPPQGGGVIPGTGMTPQQIAGLNAMMSMVKLGTPFQSLLETYYKSPQYLGEAATATKGAELQQELLLKPKIEAAIAWAKIDPNISEAERKEQITRYSKQLELMTTAQYGTQEAPVYGPDGKTILTQKMTQLELTQKRAEQAARIARGDAIPRPGDIAGTPYYRPGQAEQETQRAAVDPTQGISLLNDPRMLPKGPGTTEPVTLPNGAVVPPVSSAPPVRGSIDYMKNRQKDWSDTENEWSKGIASAQIAEQRLQAIMTVMKSYQTGAWANELSDLRAKLKVVGVSLPDSIAGDPAKAQEILKDNFTASLETMKGSGLSRWTQAELFGAQKNMAQPNLQPAANLEIGAQAIGTLRWERAMKEAWTEAQKYGSGSMRWFDPQAFQLQFVQANPVQKFIDQAKQEIGPLMGMPQPSQPGPTLPPGGVRERRWNPATRTLE